MGLAGSKAKLKLIDIQTTPERRIARPRTEPGLGSGLAKSAADTIPAPGGLSVTSGSEIGALLMEARHRSGQDLADVSRHLRIRHQYLRAIENGEFKTLPGLTYAIGYVRTYAQYLELDVERSVALFKSETQELESRHELVFPSPAPEGKVPGGAVMFVAVVLAVGAYAGWYYLNTSGRTVADYVPRIPESLQSWLGQGGSGDTGTDGFTSTAVASTTVRSTAVPSITVPTITAASITGRKAAVPLAGVAPVSTSKTNPVAEDEAARVAAADPFAVKLPKTVDSVPAAAATVTAVKSDRSGSPTSQVIGSAAAPKSVTVVSATARPVTRPAATTVAATSTAAGATPKIIETVKALAIPAAPKMDSIGITQAQAATVTDQIASTTARIVIRASADSWVQIRAADSTTVMTRVMRAGDLYEVPDRKGLHLSTGNAGALAIWVDGQAIPKLGKMGHIARNIGLDPMHLKQRLN